MGGKSGVLVRFEKYNNESQIIEYCSKRNAKDNWTLCKYFEFYETGHLWKEITEYKNGEKSIEEYNLERDLINRIRFDKNGNDITGERGNKAIPLVPFIDYKYDEKGNWVEKIIWADRRNLCQVYKREIEYYDE